MKYIGFIGCEITDKDHVRPVYLHRDKWYFAHCYNGKYVLAGSIRPNCVRKPISVMLVPSLNGPLSPLLRTIARAEVEQIGSSSCFEKKYMAYNALKPIDFCCTGVK